MVDRHNAQGDPTLALLPRHPMWNRTHINRRQDWFAEISAIQQRSAGTHGLVIAHVLVHRQGDPGCFTQFDNFLGLSVIYTQRLLSKDSSNVISVFDRFAHHIDQHIRGYSNIRDLNPRIR
jgi:hypothetical protein